ncbi:hypothetical protein F5146DRAFT_1138355 [Armillaria mellea]|nr:hypothetical protein F5146DRAFT_1138355 [Armillaria mellea]
MDVLLAMSEGHQVMSWIWLVEGGLGDGSKTDMIEVARTEWLKSHAHVLWWLEELQLVEEEMQWVQVSLSWKVDWWEERHVGWQPLALEFSEGIGAYVDKQAALIQRLVVSFSMLWGAQGKFNEDEWIDEEDAKSDVPVPTLEMGDWN